VPHESGGRAAGIAYGGARGTAITEEIRTADAGNSSAADTHQGSVSAAGSRNELSLSDYQELGEQISAILRRAEEAAEAIVHNAVEVAEQTLAEAHERASAELDAAQRDVESARQEAAAAEGEALHVHEVAARDMRQLADEIASRRQDLERASRVLEERFCRLASDIQPAERISRAPHVTALASGSASPSAREPAVERIVELVITIVLAITLVAGMLVFFFVLLP
jgi:chromosome segregation ATPase